ncbi:MAG: hypothetical protein SGJ18_07420 [Pseudomonadota bacterium]|nr:hypothetical protein [Pseudomonadota bacterium]
MIIILFLAMLFSTLGYSEECKVTSEQLAELQRISNCALSPNYRECSMKSGIGVDGNSIGASQGRLLGVNSAVEVSQQLTQQKKKRKTASLFLFSWQFALAQRFDDDFTSKVNSLAEVTETSISNKIAESNQTIRRLDESAFKIRVEAIESAREKALADFLAKNKGASTYGMLDIRVEELKAVPLTDVGKRNQAWVEISQFSRENFKDADSFIEKIKYNRYHSTDLNIANDSAFLNDQLSKGGLSDAAKKEAQEVLAAREITSKNLGLLKMQADANKAFLRGSSGRLNTDVKDRQLVKAWMENIVVLHEDKPSNSVVKIYDIVNPGSEFSKPEERAKKLVEQGKKIAEAEGRALEAQEIEKAKKIAGKAAQKYGLKALAYVSVGPLGAALALKDNVAMAHEIVSGELACGIIKEKFTPYKRGNSDNDCVPTPDILDTDYNEFLNLGDFRIQKVILERSPDLCAITGKMAKMYNPTDWTLTCTNEGFEAINAITQVKSKVFLDSKTGLPNKATFEGDEDFIENGRSAFSFDKGEVQKICIRVEGKFNSAVRGIANWAEGDVDKRFCHPSYNSEIAFDSTLSAGGLFDKPDLSYAEDQETAKKPGEQGIKYLKTNTFAFSEMGQCCSKASTTYSIDRCNEYTRKAMKARIQSEPNRDVTH